MTCVLLAFNRLFEMLAPEIAKSLFKGKRVYIWLVIPILYMLFTCFQAAFVYDIRLFAYNSNPFAGEDGWEVTKVGYIFIHGQGDRLVNRKATFFWPANFSIFDGFFNFDEFFNF